ncbi:putative membrane protein [Hathewaya proteolytica DSM 3090]|uniref:Putative membrane protein n=1 Tax=Hathewaya proteolytica DSM 3090 TaxID=1121331 RepID=A0A1M6R2X9_9CLOT|nr:hypothetical protein [Hathewaya proteolytica]SHK26802.1 putative membrane protein [Hathewaya proteolytica DSM 3090]
MKNNMSKRLVSLVVLCTMMGTQVVYAAEGIKKDESVFVVLDANGQCKSQIVSDWIHSENTGIEIKDKSDLKDIVNIKGEEKPTISGDDITWKSDKNDIYYQGKSEKQLPLEVSVKYMIDGSEVNPKDMAGKSGKFKMILKITNKEKHTVSINGKERDVYTPFMTASLLQLPTEKFTNVKVSSGQLISDSNSQIIAFLAFPGLKESLNLDSEMLDIDLPEELVIEGDVKDFEMGPIMVSATSELPEKLKEIKNSKDVNEIKDKLGELQDATNKIVDGSGKLSEGAKLLDSKLGVLNGAFGQMSSGISKLDDGAASALNGSSQLRDGSGQLSSGLSQLNSEIQGLSEKAPSILGQVGQLSQGIAQLKLGSADLYKNMDLLSVGIGKAAAGAEQLSQGAANLSQGLDQFYGEVSKSVKGTETAVSALGKNMMDMGINIASLKSTAEGQQLLASLNGSEEGRKLLNVLSLIEKDKAVLEGFKVSEGEPTPSQKLEGGYKQLKDGADKLQKGTKELSDNLKVIEQGSRKSTEGSGKISEGINAMTEGLGPVLSDKDVVALKLQQLQQAVSQLNDGSQKLFKGASDMNSGLKELKNGTSSLKSASGEMQSGIGKLKDGSATLAEKSSELSDGTKKFQEEGISKIDDVAGKAFDNIGELIEVKDEMFKLSDQYQCYTSVGENMDGTVKFVMKTDEIKKPEVKNEVVKVEEKKSIWQKIGDFFTNLF